jgi:hypothetical protein
MYVFANTIIWHIHGHTDFVRTRPNPVPPIFLPFGGSYDDICCSIMICETIGINCVLCEKLGEKMGRLRG